MYLVVSETVRNVGGEPFAELVNTHLKNKLKIVERFFLDALSFAILSFLINGKKTHSVHVDLEFPFELVQILLLLPCKTESCKLHFPKFQITCHDEAVARDLSNSKFCIILLNTSFNYDWLRFYQKEKNDQRRK